MTATSVPFSVDLDAALVIVDVQKGFGDGSRWGVRNNPQLEANLARLLDAWKETGRPIVIVRHDSVEPESPLRPGQDGNDLTDQVASVPPDLLVTKSVNSSFLGTPDLAEWLNFRGIRQIVLTGISTNTCVETTARMGQNLGFDVLFAVDATAAFPLTASDGTSLDAAELTTATVVNLSASGFANVVVTEDIVASITEPSHPTIFTTAT